MNFKSLAVKIITQYGRDVEWLTISETIHEQNDMLGLGLSAEEIDECCNELSRTIESAKLTISWDDDNG